MIIPAHETDYLPLEQVVKRYGIPAEKILQANQHYPELIEAGGLKQLVCISRLGAAEELSYEEMLERGLKITPRFIETMQSWFNSNNLELSLEPSKKVLVAKARRYLEEFRKLTYLNVGSPFIGKELYENCLDYSMNGNPEGRYQKTKVRDEIISNLELLGDIIIGYSVYDIKKMSDSQLLREYSTTNSLAIRNELIERYLPFVKSLAKRRVHKIKPNIELDDLISAGVMRLIEVITEYDASRGMKFKTCAYGRIMWGFESEIREVDMTPKNIRVTAAKIEGAKTYLRAILGRTPDDLEMMEKLGVSQKQYKRMVIDLQAANLVSLTPPVKCGGNQYFFLLDDLEGTKEEAPDARITRKDMLDVIERGLSRGEKLLLMLYKGEEFNMKETAKVIGMSEGRVSQTYNGDIVPKLKQRREKKPLGGGLLY